MNDRAIFDNFTTARVLKSCVMDFSPSILNLQEVFRLHLQVKNLLRSFPEVITTFSERTFSQEVQRYRCVVFLYFFC